MSWNFLRAFNTSGIVTQEVASWSFLDSFNTAATSEQVLSTWSAVTAWSGALERALDEAWRELQSELGYWNQRLETIGGDPASRDWSEFRPLRTSREEDWSDWLQHLLRESRRGEFARVLFGEAAFAGGRVAAPVVLREQSTSDGERRADLVVFWTEDRASHIEVKVGDQAFGKTFDTSVRLAKDNPAVRTWSHYVLLPGADTQEWQRASGRIDDIGCVPVERLTWEHVALALRVALLAGGEDLRT